MPGTLMHLALAQRVYQGIKEKLSIDKIQFFIGNIMPDEARDKTKSHFRVPSSVDGYCLPSIELIKKELFDKNDPIRLGCYCHLFFDYHFFEDYAFSQFIFDKEKGKITSKESGEEWEHKEFWSPRVFYSSYSVLNTPILKDGLVDLDDIDKMPEILPFINDERFDVRRDKTWKSEIYSFLNNKHEYTKCVLEYARCKEIIEKTAQMLVDEITG